MISFSLSLFNKRQMMTCTKKNFIIALCANNVFRSVYTISFWIALITRHWRSRLESEGLGFPQKTFRWFRKWSTCEFLSGGFELSWNPERAWFSAENFQFNCESGAPVIALILFYSISVYNDFYSMMELSLFNKELKRIKPFRATIKRLELAEGFWF